MDTRAAIKSQKINILRTGDIVYTINPAQLTPDESCVLFFFLEQLRKVGSKRIISLNKYVFPFFTPDSAVAEKLRCLGIENAQIFSGTTLFFTFTDTLVWRRCAKDAEDYRYDVYNGNMLGHGAFAEVEEINGTLVPQGNQCMRYKHYAFNNTRVAKKQSEKELQRILYEYQINRRFPEFHIKPPTFLLDGVSKSASCVVMRRITGDCLEQVINQDQLDKSKNINNIFTDKRLRLVIAFLRALARVHRHDVLHRDIKLGNVIADLSSDVVRVTILDFGLSTDLLHNDGRCDVGTLLYAPPEVFEHKMMTIKSDIYCSAWVLAQILRADDNDIFEYEPYLVAYQKVASRSRHVKFQNLFSGMDDLSKPHQNMINDVLNKMVMEVQAERCNLDFVIQQFEKILLQRKLETVADHKLHKNLEHGYYAGIKLRNTLNAFPLYDPENFVLCFPVLKEAFREALRGLADTPQVIIEFTEQTGLETLRGLGSSEQITDTINNLLTVYVRNQQKLLQMCDELKVLVKKLEKEYGKRIEDGIQDGLALDRMHSKVSGFMSQACEEVNTDTICAINRKLEKHINKMETEISRVCESHDFSSIDIDDEPDAKVKPGCLRSIFSICGLFGGKKTAEPDRREQLLVRF